MNQPAAVEETKIQKADPGARKRAAWSVVAVVFVALSFMVFSEIYGERFSHWFDSRFPILAGTTITTGFTMTLGLLIALPMIVAAVFGLRQANRILESERFPAPGQKVVKDTPIITGKEAIRYGRALKILLSLMILAGLLMPFVLTLLLMKF